MKKKLLITLLIGAALTLSSCNEGEAGASTISFEGYTAPNVSRIGVDAITYGGQYNYLVDNNTGVVYLECHYGQGVALTVMFNSDGSIMTKDDIRPK